MLKFCSNDIVDKDNLKLFYSPKEKKLYCYNNSDLAELEKDGIWMIGKTAIPIQSLDSDIYMIEENRLTVIDQSYFIDEIEKSVVSVKDVEKLISLDWEKIRDKLDIEIRMMYYNYEAIYKIGYFGHFYVVTLNFMDLPTTIEIEKRSYSCIIHYLRKLGYYNMDITINFDYQKYLSYPSQTVRSCDYDYFAVFDSKIHTANKFKNRYKLDSLYKSQYNSVLRQFWSENPIKAALIYSGSSLYQINPIELNQEWTNILASLRQYYDDKNYRQLRVIKDDNDEDDSEEEKEYVTEPFCLGLLRQYCFDNEVGDYGHNMYNFLLLNYFVNKKRNCVATTLLLYLILQFDYSDYKFITVMEKEHMDAIIYDYNNSCYFILNTVAIRCFCFSGLDKTNIKGNYYIGDNQYNMAINLLSTHLIQKVDRSWTDIRQLIDTNITVDPYYFDIQSKLDIIYYITILVNLSIKKHEPTRAMINSKVAKLMIPENTIIEVIEDYKDNVIIESDVDRKKYMISIIDFMINQIKVFKDCAELGNILGRYKQILQ